MDQTKVLQLINQMIIDQCLKLMGVEKIKRITLFTVFPYTAAPNLSEARSFILLEEPHKFFTYQGQPQFLKN